LFFHLLTTLLSTTFFIEIIFLYFDIFSLYKKSGLTIELLNIVAKKHFGPEILQVKKAVLHKTNKSFLPINNNEIHQQLWGFFTRIIFQLTIRFSCNFQFVPIMISFLSLSFLLIKISFSFQLFYVI